MASTRALRPSLLSTTRLLHLHSRLQRRTFLFAASAPPQSLTAHRTLPYPSAPIYSIIADVPSYASFLPYCQRSDITKWSAPDALYNRRWPSEGTLASGWGDISESFVSRVYCVPGRIVESVGGDAETSINSADIAHHLEQGRDASRRAGEKGVLSHLRSKWTIEPLSQGRTGVTLAVEYAFTNPLYAALSGGAAPKVAEFMIRAFEQRVKALLESNPDMVNASLAELDGSRMKR